MRTIKPKKKLRVVALPPTCSLSPKGVATIWAGFKALLDRPARERGVKEGDVKRIEGAVDHLVTGVDKRVRQFVNAKHSRKRVTHRSPQDRGIVKKTRYGCNRMC